MGSTKDPVGTEGAYMEGGAQSEGNGGLAQGGSRPGALVPGMKKGDVTEGGGAVARLSHPFRSIDKGSPLVAFIKVMRPEQRIKKR